MQKSKGKLTKKTDNKSGKAAPKSSAKSKPVVVVASPPPVVSQEPREEKEDVEPQTALFPQAIYSHYCDLGVVGILKIIQNLNKQKEASVRAAKNKTAKTRRDLHKVASGGTRRKSDGTTEVEEERANASEEEEEKENECASENVTPTKGATRIADRGPLAHVWDDRFEALPTLRSDIISGKVKGVRQDIVDKYNDGKLDVLFFTDAAHQGCDLKYTAKLRLLEAHRSRLDESQTIYRALRFMSHGGLHFVVDVLKYLSVFPSKKPTAQEAKELTAFFESKYLRGEETDIDVVETLWNMIRKLKTVDEKFEEEMDINYKILLPWIEAFHRAFFFMPTIDSIPISSSSTTPPGSKSSHGSAATATKKRGGVKISAVTKPLRTSRKTDVTNVIPTVRTKQLGVPQAAVISKKGTTKVPGKGAGSLSTLSSLPSSSLSIPNVARGTKSTSASSQKLSPVVTTKKSFAGSARQGTVPTVVKSKSLPRPTLSSASKLRSQRHTGIDEDDNDTVVEVDTRNDGSEEDLDVYEEDLSEL